MSGVLRVVTRRLLGRHAVGADDGNHHARADRPEVHFLDIALQIDDADAVEHRRSDAGGAERHGEESGEECSESKREAERERTGARDPGEAGEQGCEPGRKPQNRLAVGRQIERDPAHRRDREPEEEPPVLDLPRQRAGEGPPPVRGVGGRPGETGGRRQNASAPGG